MYYAAKAAYFDENVTAPWAAAEYGPEEKTRLDRLFKHTGSLKGYKILEPGCGTGRLTEILSDHVGEQGSVTALDVSPMMVEEARHRTSGRKNVEIHCCLIEDFSTEDKSYDLILCHQVFPHFEDRGKVLRRLSGALKEEGRLIVIHFIRLEEINDLHRKAGTAVERDMMPEDKEMRRLLDEAGMQTDIIMDDDLGYFLSATKKRPIPGSGARE
jgi:ubiquinone/menaquinone biosynthesis C-methylase UbiE